MMFERILVPLDGSALAEGILPAVVSLGGRLGAEVTLLHVLESHPPSEVHGQPHLRTAPEAHAYLNRLANDLDGVTPSVHVHESPVSDVAGAIIDHSEEFGSDLIAMCRHGRSGVREFVIGTIAQRVFRLGRRPVMLLHSIGAPLPPFSPRRILVPTDLEHRWATVMNATTELALAVGAEVTLLTVVPSASKLRIEDPAARLLPGATEALLEMQLEDISRELALRVEALVAQGVDATSKIVRGEPSPAIIEEATSLPAELIVMGTHARPGLDAWYSGSVGQSVIQGASQVLLLLREP